MAVSVSIDFRSRRARVTVSISKYRRTGLAFLSEVGFDPRYANNSFQSHIYALQIDQHTLISLKLHRKLRIADYESYKLT